MPQAKYLDYQTVTATIVHGESHGEVTFSHGLQDGDGNALTPESVIIEMQGKIQGSGPVSSDAPVAKVIGKTSTQITISVCVVADNASGGDWVYQMQVTTIYWHSIQCGDRTP